MLLEVELFKLRCYVFKYKLQWKTKEGLLYRNTFAWVQNVNIFFIISAFRQPIIQVFESQSDDGQVLLATINSTCNYREKRKAWQERYLWISRKKKKNPSSFIQIMGFTIKSMSFWHDVPS